MFYYALLAAYVFVCFFLLLVVLLQQGKGGDIASAFGGGGSQTARGSATVLTKATTVLGTLFIVGALILAIIGQQGPGSLLSGFDDPQGVPLLPAATTAVETPADLEAVEETSVDPPQR